MQKSEGRTFPGQKVSAPYLQARGHTSVWVLKERCNVERRIPAKHSLFLITLESRLSSSSPQLPCLPPPPDPVWPSHHHLSPGMAVSASPSYFCISPLNPAATFESDHLIHIVPVLCFPSSRAPYCAQHKSHSPYHSQGSRILWALTSSPTPSAMQFILDLAHAIAVSHLQTSVWHYLCLASPQLIPDRIPG